MGKTKGNLAYVQASSDGTNWVEVTGINKITPKSLGTSVDTTIFCESIAPLYKDRGTVQLDWGLNLTGFWDQSDPGQALIVAGLRAMADLYMKLFYDGTNYVSGKMVVNQAVPTPDVAAYVDCTFDMDGAGLATFGP